MAVAPGEIGPDAAVRVRTLFPDFFDGPRARVAVAPGRVNLLGEHTDYNAGFVLPMAIACRVAVAFAPRGDRRIRAYALAFNEAHDVGQDETPIGGWQALLEGVVAVLGEMGIPTPALSVLIDGDIPMGAGLASSAALELSLIRAFCAAANTTWDPVAAAGIGQRAEREYAGIDCGIMDQFTAALAQSGEAIRLDCRSLAFERVPLPDTMAVVVLDTGLRRRLAATGYNERRAECLRIAESLARHRPEVRSLRDLRPEDLDWVDERLSSPLAARARHIVTENARTLLAATALATGELQEAGRLMNESHASLRDDFAVSCRELDVITALARSYRQCYGARMTGAGFGGCGVALVDRDAVASFCEFVTEEYAATTGRTPAVFVVHSARGAQVLP